MVHPIDLADLLADVDLDERVRIFETLDPDRAAQVLAAMHHDSKVELVDRMGEERLAAVIDRMADSAVADIIDHLPSHKEGKLLAKIEEEHAADIHSLRQYDERTAGGRMTRNFVSVPDTFSAEQTIKAIQGAVDSHTVDFVYVVDDLGALRGVCSLPKLMIHAPETPVTRFMRRDVTFVGPTTGQEEVARLAQKYRLRHVPVVDETMKLLGVVTLQDIIEVMKNEASADIMAVAGAGHVDPLRATFLVRLRSRVPWLAAAMGLELLLAFVMKAFSGEVALNPLSFFIPIIMAMGGNVGLQSSTTIVRGLATGDITLSKTMRLLGAEFILGCTIGLLAGIITGSAVLVMHAGGDLATKYVLIVFASMTLSITIAAALGTLTPLVIHRLRFDPAIASGPFITAINDLVNITIYLTVAAFLLPRPVP